MRPEKYGLVSRHHNHNRVKQQKPKDFTNSTNTMQIVEYQAILFHEYKTISEYLKNIF